MSTGRDGVRQVWPVIRQNRPAVFPGATLTLISGVVRNQVFFIGDGLTGDESGFAQQFFVPVEATTLYLGIADACGCHGDANGCYADNFQSWDVTFTETSDTRSQAQVLPAGARGLGCRCP